MSVAASPAVRTSRRARRMIGAYARRLPAPVVALVGSRLLVLAAGAVGVIALARHDPVAAASTRAALGPVGNLLAATVDRFDAAYYLRVAAHGYGADPSLLAFYPGYPLLIGLLAPLFGGSALVAGVTISAVSFAVALALLHRLCERELGADAARTTAVLLCFAPLSFFFTAVYSESLFLALSVGAFAAARAGRFRLACALGAAATLTRSTGLALIVPLVVGRVRARGGRADRGLAWALALPGALLAYMLAQVAAGHGLLAVLDAQRHWHRVTAGPLAGLAEGVRAGLRGLVRVLGGQASVYHPSLVGPFTVSAEAAILLGVLVAACLVTVACLRSLPLEYGLYAVAALLICLSSPWAGQPLWSLDRFALTIFPLWMVAGAWLSQRRALWRVGVPALGALALAFYAAQFASWAFVA